MDHTHHLQRLKEESRRTRLIYGIAIIVVTLVTTYLFWFTAQPQAIRSTSLFTPEFPSKSTGR